MTWYIEHLATALDVPMAPRPSWDDLIKQVHEQRLEVKALREQLGQERDKGFVTENICKQTAGSVRCIRPANHAGPHTADPIVRDAFPENTRSD